MGNRLANETSPYLLQHAGNPVDWWPWGDAAWEEARRLDRPVLLSIGYSACHWCHVMAHESFEDAAVAELMNALFVCVKVDREERPDVDSIYMQAVLAMTGHGGWPLTAFCTPGGVPYFGGTYWPPDDRQGMPGFPRVLQAAADAYRERREAVDRTGEQLRGALTPPRLHGDRSALSLETVDAAARTLAEQTDRRHGGFGSGAPKFPHAGAVDLLLHRHRATGDASLYNAAEWTLDGMARGGVYDQVGGGFHRYSVDARWAVPHFEKMLYDNALLAPVYLHAWMLSGDVRWRRVVEQTLDWAQREMLLEDGTFAATQDADSEGGEGAFFTWTPAQLREVLGEEDAALAARLFGVADSGNFEHGTTVLSLPFPVAQVATALGMPTEQLYARLDSLRERLHRARERRPRPARDDKVITAWNGLMLSAFAECGAALGDQARLDVAERCAAALLDGMVVGGVVRRTRRAGSPPRITGFLEDVAFLADSLVTLYEATGRPRWYRAARDLAEDMLERYHDPVGGFYDTAVDGEPLLVRPQTLEDGAVPAGRSIACRVLLRLASLSGDQGLRAVAEAAIAPLAPAIGRSPLGLANLAAALEVAAQPGREVAVAGDPADPRTADLLAVVRSDFDPVRVLAWGAADGVPLLEGRVSVDGMPAAYVCENFACDAPLTDPSALRQRLGAAARFPAAGPRD